MRVDVWFGPPAQPPGDWSSRAVVVIDVLRASTTIAAALHNGARAVIPLESTEEVVMRSKSLDRDQVVLAGERRSVRIEGFDLGNSPREYTPQAVAGKTILFTTTNGTRALVAAQGAREVLVGSFVNLSAIVGRLRTLVRHGAAVTLLCAGSQRDFSLEDAVCAGRIVRGLVRRRATADLNDAAQAVVLLERKFAKDLDALFATASHGKALTAAGFAEDVTDCAKVDSFPVVPVYADRQITPLGKGRRPAGPRA